MATLSDALDLVIAEKKRTQADGTVNMYEQKAKNLRRLMGTKDLATFRSSDVKEYIRARESDVSPSTVQKELVVLGQALKYARLEEWLPRTVDQIMPVKYSAKYAPRENFVPQDKMWQLVRRFPPKHGAMIAFMLATGANLSEALHARRVHIDLQKQIVFIDGTKRETRKRWVPIPPPNMPLIEFVLKNAPGQDRLFEEWTNIWRDLGQASERVGLPRLSSNDLRRTFASHLVQHGVPLDKVAKWMGHASVAMVYKVYGRSTPEADRNLLDQYYAK